MAREEAPSLVSDWTYAPVKEGRVEIAAEESKASFIFYVFVSMGGMMACNRREAILKS